MFITEIRMRPSICPGESGKTRGERAKVELWRSLIKVTEFDSKGGNF
jgi:hypothetical protein